MKNVQKNKWMGELEEQVTQFMALGVSCLASVLVLIGVGVSKVLWSWFLSDVWLKISYRHATDISGEWILEDFVSAGGPKPIPRTIVLNCKQYGWRIKGEMESLFGDQNKKFRIEGIIQSDIISFYYWAANRRQRGIGTFTLEIAQGGDLLKGNWALFNIETSQIVAKEVAFKRRTIK